MIKWSSQYFFLACAKICQLIGFKEALQLHLLEQIQGSRFIVGQDLIGP